MPNAFGYALEVPDPTSHDGWGLAGHDEAIKRYYDENLAPRGVQWVHLIKDPPIARQRPRFLSRSGAIALLRLANPGDHVIFHRAEHAFRNGHDLYETYSKWKAQGIFMSIISKGVDTSDPSQAAVLESSLRGFVFWAKLESAEKGDRTRAQVHYLRRIGRRWSTCPPHGFKFVKRADGHTYKYLMGVTHLPSVNAGDFAWR
jgi:hypothetical protein